MNNVKFLLDQKARCERWLVTPESELPGKLNHRVAGELLEQTEDELLNYLCLQIGPNGQTQWLYNDPAE